MNKIAWGSAAALAATLSPQAPIAAAQTEAVLPRRMNPLTMKVTPQSSGSFVRVWDNGPVTCDSGSVEAAAWIAPHPQFAAKQIMEFPVSVGLAIDETGRAISIRALEGGYVDAKFEISLNAENGTLKLAADNLLKSLTTRDLMPSLRASRFAADVPRTGCSLTYAPRDIATEDLSGEDLARSGAVPGVRLKPVQLDQFGGADCNTTGWSAPLLRAYPDWCLMSGREGARKWSWTRFDIDEDGVPQSVAVIASSGHDDLDREALRAVQQSRFAEGPHTGCVTPWWHNPETIPAPPAPAPASFPDYQDCNAQRGWVTPPKLTFPQAYNNRAIEGWAMLSFSIGADRVIRNPTVLTAQPSAEFGEAGKAVLTSARFDPAEEAQTGCIQIVRFAQKADKASAAASSKSGD